MLLSLLWEPLVSDFQTTVDEFPREVSLEAEPSAVLTYFVWLRRWSSQSWRAGQGLRSWEEECGDEWIAMERSKREGPKIL